MSRQLTRKIKLISYLAIILALTLSITACDLNGQVIEGTCLKFEATTNKILLLPLDKSADKLDSNIAVDSKANLEFFLPTDANEIGPLPEAGDLVRIWYKKEEPNQAKRFMNVSKTNIFKR